MPNVTKITAKKKSEFVELLRGGNTIGYSCEVLQVDRSTVFKARQRDPAFDEDVKATRITRVEMVEDSLFGNALSGNVTAQVFYLINRTRHLSKTDPEKWMDTKHIDASVGFDDVNPDEVATRLRTMLEAAKKKKAEDEATAKPARKRRKPVKKKPAAKRPAVKKPVAKKPPVKKKPVRKTPAKKT